MSLVAREVGVDRPMDSEELFDRELYDMPAIGGDHDHISIGINAQGDSSVLPVDLAPEGVKKRRCGRPTDKTNVHTPDSIAMFENLWRLNDSKIKNYCRHHARNNQELSEELYSATYLRAYTYFPAYLFTATFPCWVYRIIANLAVDWHRKKRDQVTYDLELCEATDNAWVDVIHTRVFSEDLWERINAFTTPEERELLVIFCDKKITQHDYAREHGIPPGTMKSRLFRLRKRLFTELYPIVFGTTPEEPADQPDCTLESDSQ
jgi:RNA polymerase sigma factor (sigma-70 family)